MRSCPSQLIFLWILPLEPRDPGVGSHPAAQHLRYCELLNKQSFKEKEGGDDGEIADYGNPWVR
ncbi:protein of unknown function [Candidatus Methylomirabilis oxygeniifera]|uniref:Uncharacterized protein n=1 Tax=Methylomirabilis oxygeniifera TaxID=671143 RepID=D5MHB9_METO1|nr:protein of unknown function [Candidatus Methylomirabilis oxyfera]